MLLFSKGHFYVRKTLWVVYSSVDSFVPVLIQNVGFFVLFALWTGIHISTQCGHIWDILAGLHDLKGPFEG